MFISFLDHIPLFWVFIAIVVILFAATEVGYFFGRRHVPEHKEKEAKQASVLTGATLGLLSFLLAFSFGMASNIHSARKALSLEEANVIGKAWLQVDLIRSSLQPKARELLKSYTDLRVAAIHKQTDAKLAQEIKQSEEIQNKLWALATALIQSGQTKKTDTLFVASIGEIIDLHKERIYASHKRIPLVVDISLLLIACLALSMLGYQSGLNGARSMMSRMVLILAYALVMSLIVDLDRPGEGLIAAKQQTMLELQDAMAKNQAH